MNIFNFVACIAIILVRVEGYRQCGRSNLDGLYDSPSTYLTNGVETKRHAFPWQLVVEAESLGGRSLRCGATLLNANWAATAAQCVHSFGESYHVLAGVHNLFEIHDGRQSREISREDIHTFPDYDPITLENDIALIHFKTPFNLTTANVGPICLPPNFESFYYENPSCFITGWGRDRIDGEYSANLERIWTDVLKADNCEAYLQRPLEGREVCTLDQVSHRETPCKGDEGGPLQCAVDGIFYLAGIVSKHSENCIGGVPQINVNVPHYDAWIKSLIHRE